MLHCVKKNKKVDFFWSFMKIRIFVLALVLLFISNLEISRALVMKPSILLVDEPSIGLEPKYIDMVFEILGDLQKKEKKTIILVEQNAKKGLQFADIGYVLVSGETAIAGKGDDLLNNPDVGRLFLGG